MIRLNFGNRKKLRTGYKTLELIMNEFDYLNNYDSSKKEDFHIDLSACEEIHNLPLIIIWFLAQKYKKLPCKKHISYGKKIFGKLEDVHFFDSLVSGEKVNTKSSHIISHFETFNVEVGNVNSKIKEITEKVKTLGTKGFQGEVSLHYHELLNNAFDHSFSKENVASFAILNKTTNEIEICVADMGQGFKNAFISNPALKQNFIKKNGLEILEEAMKKNITCNNPHSPHPKYETKNAGIGLYYLRKFIELHEKSSMTILSDEGLIYFYEDGTMKRHKLRNRWEGSIVYFRTNIDLKVSNEYNNLINEWISYGDIEIN